MKMRMMFCMEIHGEAIIIIVAVVVVAAEVAVEVEVVVQVVQDAEEVVVLARKLHVMCVVVGNTGVRNVLIKTKNSPTLKTYSIFVRTLLTLLIVISHKKHRKH